MFPHAMHRIVVRTTLRTCILNLSSGPHAAGGRGEWAPASVKAKAALAAAATGAEHPCIPPFPSWSRAPDRCAAPPPAPPAGARANEHRVDTVRTLTRSYNENRGATTL